MWCSNSDHIAFHDIERKHNRYWQKWREGEYNDLVHTDAVFGYVESSGRMHLHKYMCTTLKLYMYRTSIWSTAKSKSITRKPKQKYEHMDAQIDKNMHNINMKPDT